MIMLQSTHDQVVHELITRMGSETRRRVALEFQHALSTSEVMAWKEAAEDRWRWLERMRDVLDQCAEAGFKPAQDLLAEWRRPVKQWVIDYGADHLPTKDR